MRIWRALNAHWACTVVQWREWPLCSRSLGKPSKTRKLKRTCLNPKLEMVLRSEC
jgi:hypothetical protein